MKLLLLFLCSVGLWGQAYDAPALAPFCNGIQYGAAQQADLAAVAPPYNTLVYAKSFTCIIPVSCSLCKVTLGFFENRLPPLTGPKQRLFTVSFNGNTSDVLDLFTLAGAQTPYTRTWTVPVYDGKLRLVFSASVLNALVSTVTVSDAAAITGEPCAPPQNLTDMPKIYAILPDGTCFQVRPIPPVGFLSDSMAVWTAADDNGEIHVQSFFAVIKPIDKTQPAQ